MLKYISKDNLKSTLWDNKIIRYIILGIILLTILSIIIKVAKKKANSQPFLIKVPRRGDYILQKDEDDNMVKMNSYQV